MPNLRWLAPFAFGLLALSGCGNGGEKESSVLDGTWGNPAYEDGVHQQAKMVFGEGTFAFYTKSADVAPYVTGHWTVEQDWTAADGHYFQCEIIPGPYTTSYWLIRMRDNNTFEAQTSNAAYPTVVDISTGEYGIWLRQPE